MILSGTNDEKWEERGKRKNIISEIERIHWQSTLPNVPFSLNIRNRVKDCSINALITKSTPIIKVSQPLLSNSESSLVNLLPLFL